MERLLHLCVCVSQTLVLVGVEFYIALPSVCVRAFLVKEVSVVVRETTRGRG